MNASEIEKHKALIDKMSQYEMAGLWRFSPPGHPYFDSTTPLASHFSERFKALGGFTPEISKSLGWR